MTRPVHAVHWQLDKLAASGATTKIDEGSLQAVQTVANSTSHWFPCAQEDVAGPFRRVTDSQVLERMLPTRVTMDRQKLHSGGTGLYSITVM